MRVAPSRLCVARHCHRVARGDERGVCRPGALRAGPVGYASPIVGGTNADAGQWPDAVAVIGTGGYCTGTLIAPDVVLTAGHCAKLSPFQVIANTTDFSKSGGVRAAVATTMAHADWQASYDVAAVASRRRSPVSRRADLGPRAPSTGSLATPKCASSGSAPPTSAAPPPTRNSSRPSPLSPIPIAPTVPAASSRLRPAGVRRRWLGPGRLVLWRLGWSGVPRHARRCRRDRLGVARCFGRDHPMRWRRHLRAHRQDRRLALASDRPRDRDGCVRRRSVSHRRRRQRR